MVTTLAGNGTPNNNNGTGIKAQFNLPGSLVVDGSGNIYVADGGIFEIRKVTSSGVVTTLAGNWQVTGTSDGAGSAAQFNYPNGIALDGAATLCRGYQ